MSETPEENPFESPQSPPGAAEHGWPSKPYWTAVIFTVVAVVLLLPFLPGLAILVALFAAPGLVRAHIRLRREYFATGQEATATQQFQDVLISMLVGGLVTVAAGAAFFAVCLGGFVAAESVLPGRNDYGITNLLRAGLPLGSIAGLTAFYFLFRWSLGKKVLPGQGKLYGEDEKE